MPYDEAARKKYRQSPKGKETQREYNRKYYHQVLKHNPKETAKRKARNTKNYYKRYGLTPEQVTEMKEKGCNLCGTREGKLNIDHSHETGKVRGVLCNACNIMIGYVERARKFTKLWEYLQKGEANAAI